MGDLWAQGAASARPSFPKACDLPHLLGPRQTDSGACFELGDSVGSVCQRRSQKLRHIRFSGTNPYQADMAVGRSNRKARRGQWCAVLIRQPASVTETPLRGVLERGDESGPTLSGPIRKGETMPCTID
jgi:hypothetical protein